MGREREREYCAIDNDDTHLGSFTVNFFFNMMGFFEKMRKTFDEWNRNPFP